MTTTTPHERHSLMEAIRTNDKDTITAYLHDGKDIRFYTQKDYNGEDPAIIDFDPQIAPDYRNGILHQGSECVRSVRANIDRDTDFSFLLALEEFTPLSYACFLDRTDIAKMLVAHGAEVNTHLTKVTWGNENEEYCSPYFPALWWAMAHHNTDLFLFLLDHHAVSDMFYKYDEFQDAVEFACDAGHVEAMEHFLQMDEELYQRPFCDNDFLLLSACYRYDLPMIRLLLRYGKKPVGTVESRDRGQVYTCLTTLEMGYFERHFQSDISYWDLEDIFLEDERSLLEKYDVATHLTRQENELDTIAQLVAAGESLETIRCPLLREWVAALLPRQES